MSLAGKPDPGVTHRNQQLTRMVAIKKGRWCISMPAAQFMEK